MTAVPRMLLIGATAKNAGKTTLACRIVERFRDRGIIVVKATIHRGDEKGQWSVTRETGAHPDKDTGRLLAAGAREVLWLRSDEDCVERAVAELLSRIPDGVPLLCESNTLRRFVTPSLFLMVRREDDDAIKPTAQAVIGKADLVVHSFAGPEGVSFHPDILSRLLFEDGIWRLSS